MAIIKRLMPLILAILFILSSCNKTVGGMIPVSEQDNGKTVELLTGDKLIVELEGNPTTGYLWEVESGEGKELKQEGEAEFNPASSLVGSGGKVSLQFKAVTPGKVVLRLVYHRPWEQDIPPEKTYEIEVIIK